ncbi:hypothetical protein I4U23_029839 [Adineta vaga]|nr:hypothetical protein I4U23_029839 [Adineta vaga]
MPMILYPTTVYVEPGANILLNCSLLITEHNNTNSKQSPITWHFLSNQMNKTKPHDVYIRRKSMNNTFSSFLIINTAHIFHTGIWTCAYRRQRLSAKVVVEKDILKHQRISALLANCSRRQLTLNNFLLFFVLFLFVTLQH